MSVSLVGCLQADVVCQSKIKSNFIYTVPNNKSLISWHFTFRVGQDQTLYKPVHRHQQNPAGAKIGDSHEEKVNYIYCASSYDQIQEQITFIQQFSGSGRISKKCRYSGNWLGIFKCLWEFVYMVLTWKGLGTNAFHDCLMRKKKSHVQFCNNFRQYLAWWKHEYINIHTIMLTMTIF